MMKLHVLAVHPYISRKRLLFYLSSGPYIDSFLKDQMSFLLPSPVFGILKGSSRSRSSCRLRARHCPDINMSTFYQPIFPHRQTGFIVSTECLYSPLGGNDNNNNHHTLLYLPDLNTCPGQRDGLFSLKIDSEIDLKEKIDLRIFLLRYIIIIIISIELLAPIHRHK